MGICFLVTDWSVYFSVYFASRPMVAEIGWDFLC